MYQSAESSVILRLKLAKKGTNVSLNYESCKFCAENPNRGKTNGNLVKFYNILPCLILGD